MEAVNLDTVAQSVVGVLEDLLVSIPEDDPSFMVSVREEARSGSEQVAFSRRIDEMLGSVST